jgi:molybdopterin-guanine dinucleotide biosynthesis protein A
MILGAVLAGGKATRFGSDKALAEAAGCSLLDRAVAQLAAQCDAVVVAGREEAPVPVLADRPRPGMGPLGGIAAALHHARDNGFAAVLTSGVDSPGLPGDLAERLAPPPAYLADQPVVGLWPVEAAETVDAILAGEGRHSLRALAEALGARAVTLDTAPANINTPADLAAWETSHGL